MCKSLSLFGVVLPLAMLITGAPQANAFTITQPSVDKVNGGAITACVDVNGAGTANGTPVGPFPCNNQFNEQWAYVNGWFLGIGSTGAETKCLSVKGNSTANGAPVELDTCVPGNKTQLWEVGFNGINGSSEIFNEGAFKCLDSQGEIGGNLQLVINSCLAGATGQLWDLK